MASLEECPPHPILNHSRKIHRDEIRLGLRTWVQCPSRARVDCWSVRRPHQRLVSHSAPPPEIGQSTSPPGDDKSLQQMDPQTNDCSHGAWNYDSHKKRRINKSFVPLRHSSSRIRTTKSSGINNRRIHKNLSNWVHNLNFWPLRNAWSLHFSAASSFLKTPALPITAPKGIIW